MSKWTPNNMEWFLAELVQQLQLANSDTSTVWVNTVLIQANTLEQAHEKALKRGEEYNDRYTNPDGIEVTSTFRGLRDLFLIYDKLEDGAEILFEELEEASEAEIAEIVRAKEQLAVFQTHDEELIEPADKATEGAPQ